MPWAAAGAVVGAVITGNAAGDAADTQAAAADRAAAQTAEQFETTRQNLAPFAENITGELAPQFQSGFDASNPYASLTTVPDAPAALPEFHRTWIPPVRAGKERDAEPGRWQISGGPSAEQQAAFDTATTDRNNIITRNAELTQQLNNPNAEITGSLTLQGALSGASGQLAQEQAYAQFQESPGVAFMREQGMRGIGNSISQSGRGGGSRLKAISEFNQGLALQDFNNQFNRLGSITGTGLAAQTSLAGVASDASAAQATQTNLAGAAQAQGQIAQGNAFASGLNQLGTFAGSQSQSNTGSTTTRPGDGLV